MSDLSPYINISEHGSAIVVEFMASRITNINEIRIIGDALSELTTKRQPELLILDLGKVNYLPSAMLGKLAAVRKAVRSYDGQLKLACLRDSVAQILQMTRLDRIFDIYESVDAALQQDLSKDHVLPFYSSSGSSG